MSVLESKVDFELRQAATLWWGGLTYEEQNEYKRKYGVKSKFVYDFTLNEVKAIHKKVLIVEKK